MSIMKRFGQNLQNIGFKKTIEAAVGMLEDIQFDRNYDVDTMSRHQLTTKDVDSVNLVHAVNYQPTRVRAFRALMKSAHAASPCS